MVVVDFGPPGLVGLTVKTVILSSYRIVYVGSPPALRWFLTEHADVLEVEDDVVWLGVLIEDVLRLVAVVEAVAVVDVAVVDAAVDVVLRVGVLGFCVVGSLSVSVSLCFVIRVSVAVGSDMNVSDAVSVTESDTVAVQNPSSPHSAISVQHSSAQHVSPSGQLPPSQQISVSGL